MIVRKAGDVIPEVVGPCSRSGRKGAAKWKFPKDCPACGQPLVRAEGEAATNCVNVDCPGAALGAHRALRRRDGHRRPRRGARPPVHRRRPARRRRRPLLALTVDKLVPLERIGERVGAAARRQHRDVEVAAAGRACSSGWASRTSARPPPRTSPASSATSTGSPTPRSRSSPRSRGSGPIVAQSVQRVLRPRPQPRARSRSCGRPA